MLSASKFFQTQLKEFFCRQSKSIFDNNFKTLGVTDLPNNHIYLHFEEHIEIEKVVLAFDFDSLLVEIGSFLGKDSYGSSLIGTTLVQLIAITKFLDFFLKSLSKK